MEAIIVGSLGSWDPKNDNIIKTICSEKYAKVKRMIIVSETMSNSEDIFFEHMKIAPQDSGGGATLVAMLCLFSTSLIFVL